jgi:hypothetical protein
MREGLTILAASLTTQGVHGTAKELRPVVPKLTGTRSDGYTVSHCRDRATGQHEDKDYVNIQRVS